MQYHITQMQKTPVEALSPKWHEEANRPRGPHLLSKKQKSEGGFAFQTLLLIFVQQRRNKSI